LALEAVMDDAGGMAPARDAWACAGGFGGYRSKATPIRALAVASVFLSVMPPYPESR
jgi:hypothetical protein